MNPFILEILDRMVISIIDSYLTLFFYFSKNQGILIHNSILLNCFMFWGIALVRHRDKRWRKKERNKYNIPMAAILGIHFYTTCMLFVFLSAVVVIPLDVIRFSCAAIHSSMWSQYVLCLPLCYNEDSAWTMVYSDWILYCLRIQHFILF